MEMTDYDTDQIGVTLRQRAAAEREFRKVRESDSPFAELAVSLYDEEIQSFTDIYAQFAAVEEALRAAALAEDSGLIPEWKITVKRPDPNTPSGYRHETVTRAHQDPRKAEAELREQGYEVVPRKTERDGYAEVA
ncbi:hypothetical protein [Halorubrum sp. Atlit-26R]|uniref:hypothetical protein n=1 Tax=Halorubrum sp. Atlit-26R TaxID=2282128 RepID=UPI0011C3A65A|nr:hypothetical protein [Halorubrum sp. Atlit-26R]